MQTVILGGPALALDNSVKTRHYSVINAEDATQFASVTIDVAAKTRTLVIHKTDCTEEATAVVCRFLKIVAQNIALPITAQDANAVAFVYMLNSNVSSNNPDIVAAWTSFTFELEMRSQQKDGTINRLRFLGANIKGIKDIASASGITLTITPKQK